MSDDTSTLTLELRDQTVEDFKMIRSNIKPHWMQREPTYEELLEFLLTYYYESRDEADNLP